MAQLTRNICLLDVMISNMLAHVAHSFRENTRRLLPALFVLAAGFLGACATMMETPLPTEPLAFSDLPPFPATGAKVGEMKPTSALIHTYLLSQPAPELLQQPYSQRNYRGMAGDVCVEYSTAQLPKLSSFLLSRADFDSYRQRQAKSEFTPWISVPQGVVPVTNPLNAAEKRAIRAALASNYSLRVPLVSLQPHTPYYFRLWTKGRVTDLVRPGEVHRFTTAPEPDALRDVSFIATTCFNHSKMKDLEKGVWPASGFRMHRAILDLVQKGQLSFDFVVINGDTVYLDKQAASYRSRPEFEIKGMRARFFDNYILPLTRDFFRQFPAYFLKDDHDWRFNDADPVFDSDVSPPRFYRQIGKFYRGPPGPFLGKEIFEEMHPVETGAQAIPYRTFRWGRGLQIWLLEIRECRHPNGRDLSKYGIENFLFAQEGKYDKHLRYPDYCGKPSIEEGWGRKQFSWLTETLKESDAYFKIIISPTPVLGPDQRIYPEFSLHPLKPKADNHVHRFRKELASFMEFLRRERLANVYFVTGDRHFLWHSRYQTRNGQFALHEFGSGPFADDIVPLGNVFYQDQHGQAELVDSLLQAGFVHVQTKDVAGKPKLRINWYVMEDWQTATVHRWKHSFELPLIRFPE